MFPFDDVIMNMISGLLNQKQVSRAGTSNYIPQTPSDVITCPCPHISFWHNTPDLFITTNNPSARFDTIETIEKHHWETNVSEIQIKLRIFSFKKMHLKLSIAKWWPFCLGVNCNLTLAILVNIVSVFVRMTHYSDVTWASCRLKLPATGLYVPQLV